MRNGAKLLVAECRAAAVTVKFGVWSLSLVFITDVENDMNAFDGMRRRIRCRGYGKKEVR